MKKLYIFPVLIAIALVACTSSEYATYRPAGSNQPNWQINVYHKSGAKQNFRVVINDSTVINKNANFFTGNLESEGHYREKDVKLMVSYSRGFLGFGSHYNALVMVNNELAGKFRF